MSTVEAGAEFAVADALTAVGGDELDDLDLTLIDELQRDGRVSFAEVARRVGVTEKTVRRRVNRMIDQRFVTIAAVTDPASLGFHCVALVLISTDGSRNPADVAADLARMPQADYITVTTGPFPVQVELMTSTPAEMDAVVSALIRPLPGVGAVEVVPYLRLHYQQARLSPPRDDSVGIRPRPLDDTDRAIIAYLAADGRAPLRDLAPMLGVSEAKIRFRYSKLVESGAVRVMCIVNPLRLGHRFTSWVAIRVGEGGRAQVVAEALTELSSVSYVAITVGRCDVLAEVVADSGGDLLMILDDQIRALPGVSGVEAWVYVALHYKAIRPRRAEDTHARDIQIV